MIARSRWVALTLSVVFTVYGAGNGHAATFPDRTVQLLVGFGPGGGVDIFARRVAQKLTEKWGKPVLVVNKVGADGAIGAEFVAHAAADGYTLLMASNSHASIPSGSPPPYDPSKSFAPVILAATNGQALLVNPAVPASTLKDLIALAKARPGQLNFGNPGTGTPSFLATETFVQRSGIKMVAVPFTGTAPALTSLTGGEIQVLSSAVTASAELVRAGKVRALAVSTAKRSGVLPDVPTVAEAGDLPGFEVTAWFGILAPAGTPGEIVGRIHDDIAAALNAPDVRESLAREDFTVIASTPSAFGEFLDTQIRRVAEVMKALTTN